MAIFEWHDESALAHEQCTFYGCSVPILRRRSICNSRSVYLSLSDQNQILPAPDSRNQLQQFTEGSTSSRQSIYTHPEKSKLENSTSEYDSEQLLLPTEESAAVSMHVYLYPALWTSVPIKHAIAAHQFRHVDSAAIMQTYRSLRGSASCSSSCAPPAPPPLCPPST